MDRDVFESIKRFVGFSPDDEQRLCALRLLLSPHLESVVDRFYDVIRADATAMSVFAGGEAQIQRQRLLLTGWLDQLFKANYDEPYLRLRIDIGSAHVRVGLNQHFMVTGMQIILEGLTEALHKVECDNRPLALRTIQRACALDLAIMLESYKGGYSEKVRESEREAVEQKLTRAEHLAEIGQLAASLAHEIKNPLAGISGAIQIIHEGLGPDHPHGEILHEVMGQINRLDAVVKDLLVYARPTNPRFVACNLDVVIKRVLTVLREEPSARNVAISHTRADGMPDIEADEAKIEQLAMNLVLNAAQACVGSGEVSVRTGFDEHNVTFVVSDTGCGVDGDTLRRAFEAFYTSKSKGTGLGLPICQSIVEAHKGSIDLQSEVGSGTRVTARLPRRQTNER